jgi:hypothetical protein
VLLKPKGARIATAIGDLPLNRKVSCIEADQRNETNHIRRVALIRATAKRSDLRVLSSANLKSFLRVSDHRRLLLK